MHKRRRDEDEPEEGTEKRLINLIVHIGDKSIVDLNSHLQGLTAALNDELGTFRLTITDTILDCVRGLQHKTPVYGALCGLLTAAEPRFGEDIVADVQRDLQEALDDHATFSIRGFCRFAVELANARVLTIDSVLGLLETLLAVRQEPDVLPARAEWFCCIVLDCIALGGATFSAQAPERLASLMQSLRDFDAARKAATAPRTPALLLAYGAATKAGEVCGQALACLRRKQTDPALWPLWPASP
jgi:nuclear cap-binding protein subunit 1